MKKQNKLYIPVNIPESRAYDIFSGFGMKELAITGVSFLIAIIAAIITNQITDQILYSAIIGMGIVGITVMIIKRDQYDESMIDQLKIIKEFNNAQKQYEYEYYDTYKGSDK